MMKDIKDGKHIFFPQKQIFKSSGYRDARIWGRGLATSSFHYVVRVSFGLGSTHITKAGGRCTAISAALPSHCKGPWHLLLLGKRKCEDILFQRLFIKMQCCSTLFYSLLGDSGQFPCPFTFKYLQAQMFIILGTTSHTDKTCIKGEDTWWFLKAYEFLSLLGQSPMLIFQAYIVLLPELYSTD